MRKALKWIGIVLAVLVLPIVALYVAGLFVEREHSATTSATIAAPPDRVFSAITNVEAFPSWREGVTSVRVLSRDPLRWREDTEDGPITFEVVERVENERLVTRIADEDLPFGGTWTYVLAAGGDSTRLTITEDGWIDLPPWRVLAKYAGGYDATMRAYLAQLADHLD